MKHKMIGSAPAAAVLMLMMSYSMLGISDVFYTRSPIWPPYLLFSAAAIALLASLSKSAKTRLDSVAPSILLGTALLACITLSLILQAAIQPEVFETTGRSSRDFPFAVAMFGSAWFLVGTLIQRLNFGHSPVLSLCAVVFLGTAVFINLDGGTVISYYAVGEKTGKTDVSHLLVGEPAAFLLALSIAFSESRTRILIGAISIVILFALGGRAAVVIFFLSCVILSIAKKEWGAILAYTGLLCSGLIAVTLGWTGGIEDDTAVSRMLLLDGVSADISAIEREEFFSKGVLDLPNQMLIGDPGLLIRRFGTLGGDIHNLLSAWQFFGFFSFVLMSIATAWIGRYIWRHRHAFRTPVDDLGMLLYFYCTLSVLTSKGITFYPFWLVLGFWLWRISETSRWRAPPRAALSNYPGNK